METRLKLAVTLLFGGCLAACNTQMLLLKSDGSSTVDGPHQRLDQGPDAFVSRADARRDGPFTSHDFTNHDAAVDATPDTALAADAAAGTDASQVFPHVLDGVWLVGWLGGLNRFSWIRFNVTSPAGGTAMINAGTLGSGTVPYWTCNGSATWYITAKPNTILITFPSTQCTSSGLAAESYTFTGIKPYTDPYPNGAQRVATIEAPGSSPAVVSGYGFPPDQCDAALTTCKDPL